ncbi:pleckstrin homology domain-containing family A member 8 [Rhinatrema bivittatum]|uniref:pleckstrin homology domain-containing family A member 8 n=1 Tax=Rhinatrema bivittatum TaxID=194408 RepID=UPI001126AACE|nr:pleckstrin homology domain-containing family A member 8 [Rhinatrema bivittatum]
MCHRWGVPGAELNGAAEGMEGVLYKWTNYLSGWQPRWFLLCGGILSYYDSREDAWKGCKGSIQMAVCEIQVHSADNTRMDLTIPGEQCFYLKARNAAERQKWLVALGSAKACLTDIRTKKEKEFNKNTLTLKKKMSELRLYCDVLVQQVEKAKAASSADVPDPEETTGMGLLLTATCSTFLKTLEECMQVANVAFTSELIDSGTPPTSPLQLVQPNKAKHHKWSAGITSDRHAVKIPGKAVSFIKQTDLNTICENGSVQAEVRYHKLPYVPNRTVLELQIDGKGQGKAEDKLAGERGDEATEDGNSSSVSGEKISVSDSLQSTTESAEDEAASHQQEAGARSGKDLQTFFSAMSHRFSDIELQEDDGIPTELFLDSCYAIVPVLDKLGPTVFAPVKMDFVGNIKKINQKFITNKEEFTTLQRIVLHEVDTNVAQVRNSATEALLWLKRGLKFLKGFLKEVKNGETNIQVALNNAYGETLRQYHGWVVRGVFALALRASPTYEDFVAALTVREEDAEKEAFSEAIKRDLDLYLPAMERHLEVLDTLYEEHGLESDEVV